MVMCAYFVNEFKPVQNTSLLRTVVSDNSASFHLQLRESRWSDVLTSDVPR